MIITVHRCSLSLARAERKSEPLNAYINRRRSRSSLKLPGNYRHRSSRSLFSEQLEQQRLLLSLRDVSFLSFSLFMHVGQENIRDTKQGGNTGSGLLVGRSQPERATGAERSRRNEEQAREKERKRAQREKETFLSTTRRRNFERTHTTSPRATRRVNADADKRVS